MRPEWHGMACVLTVAVVEDGRAIVGHVGDTRLYKLRNGRIEKATRDHSPVGEREDAHELSEVEAMRHPRRNEVYRDVGSEPHDALDPDFIDLHEIAVRAGRGAASLQRRPDRPGRLDHDQRIVATHCAGRPPDVVRRVDSGRERRGRQGQRHRRLRRGRAVRRRNSSRRTCAEASTALIPDRAEVVDADGEAPRVSGTPVSGSLASVAAPRLVVLLALILGYAIVS